MTFSSHFTFWRSRHAIDRNILLILISTIGVVSCDAELSVQKNFHEEQAAVEIVNGTVTSGWTGVGALVEGNETSGYSSFCTATLIDMNMATRSPPAADLG